MFKNHLKIAWRNLIKDKQFTLLNVTGLAAGIACTLLIWFWVKDELSYDRFFKDSDRIYQVMEHRKNSGSQSLSDESSGLVSETLKLQDPDVEYAAAVAPPEWYSKFTLTNGDKNIKATGQYVGPDYFNIFSFRMLRGDKSKVLAAKNSIVISDDLARRLFGTSNVVGRMLKFQHDKDFSITGVFEKVPVHSSQQFDFVLSFDYLASVPGQQWVKSWGNGGPHDYVKLKKGADVDAINKRIANMITKNDGDTNRVIFLSKFSNAYLQNTFSHGARVGGRAEYVKLFSLIAVFILIIACINFMNLSTARASGRMKEVGIKKVVGAPRIHLIVQFLAESVLLSAIATVFAVIIAWLLLPQFNLLTGKNIQLHFDWSLIVALAAITLFTGLISGSYPALYLSKFKPLEILKDKLKSSVAELLARKGLVVFQFTLSVMLIVAVLVVYRQISFIQSTNPGYNKDNIVRFDDDGRINGNEEAFVARLRNIPGVVNASYTSHALVGRNFGTANVAWPGDDTQKTYFEGFWGAYNFIETLNMKLAAGRSYARNYGNEFNKVMLNETAVKEMHLKNPIGANIRVMGDNFQVIGVVKDFHFESLHQAVVPAFILLNGPGNPWSKFITRIKVDHQAETIERIKQLYEQFNPGFPFTYNFLDEAYQKQYESEVRISVLSKYFSGLAILISCLGLFGLVAFTAQKRRKEFGIRKVIGATVKDIAVMLTRDFLQLVLIAVFVATPVIWLAMHQWLQGFAYRISMGPFEFLVAGVAILAITLLTVGIHAIKVALLNPVKSLRTE